MSGCDGSIVRRVIRFPFMNESGFQIATAIPGASINGTAGFLASGSWAITDPNGASLEQCMQRVALPRQQGLRAISIAPDSAIASCDISFGSVGDDSQRQRVTVGHPLIGDFGPSHDFCHVSCPVSFPLIGAQPVSASPSFVFDALPMSAGSGFTTAAWTFPLRLNFWYGDTLPVHGALRAPYHGRVVVSLPTAAVNSNAYFCLDGRRMATVVAWSESASFDLQIDEVVPVAVLATPTNDGFALITRVPRQTPGITTATRYDLMPFASHITVPASGLIAAPMPAPHVIRVHCRDAIGVPGARNAIDVYAWD